MRGGRWQVKIRVLCVLLLIGTMQISSSFAAEVPPTCGTSTAPAGFTTTLCITAPAAGDTVAGRVPVAATVQITGTAPAVNGVQFLLDGNHLLFDFQAPYSFTLHTYLSTVGPHTLSASVAFSGGYSSTPVNMALNFGATSAPAVAPFAPSPGSAAGAGQPVVLATAGDGATGMTAERGVADLISSWNPNLFLYLGDVYQEGLPEEYLNWYGEDGTFFSKFRAISDPTVGNHEYTQAGADPFFDYWGKPPDYYSVTTTNGWHIVSLDDAVNDGQDVTTSPQYQWLSNDLKANAAACTIVEWHRPVFSLNPDEQAGNFSDYWRLMTQDHVTVLLSGHSHNYQRWQPLDADGKLSPTGLTEFVVGTAGNWISPFSARDPRVAAGFDTTATAWGALKLGLSSAGATFQFQSIAGQTEDFGSIPCQGKADKVAPTAPTGLTAKAVSGRETALSWTAATDNVGVTRYQIVRNGAVVATAPGYQTSYSDTTVAAGTRYQYSVVAEDAAGNRSAASEPAAVTTPDAAPVFVQGVSASTGTRVASMTMTLSKAVEAGDLLVGWFGQYDAPGQVTVSDAVDGAWTRLQGEPFSHSSGDVALYYVKTKAALPAGSTVSVAAGAPTYLQAAVGDYWGSAAAGVVAASSVASGNGTSADSGATGSVAAGSLVFAALITGGAPGAVSPGTTNGVPLLVRSSTSSRSVVGSDALAASAGPQSGSFALGSATDWYAAAAVFRAASTGDTTPPTVPTDVHASAASSSTVDVRWSASDDNVAVTGYTVYRDGTALGDTSAAQLSYTDRTAAARTRYGYTVVAYDAAGNRSPASAAAIVTTPAPTATFVQSGVVGTGSRVTTATIALPKPIRAGDVLVGWFGQYDAPGAVSVSDDRNGAWTRVQGQTFRTGKGDIALFYVRAPADEPRGVTITLSASSATYLQGSAADYGGPAAPGQLAGSAIAAGKGGVADSGPTGLMPAGVLVVTALMTGGSPGSVTPGPSAGVTPIQRAATKTGSVAVADVIPGAAGAQDATFTLATSTDWYAMCAVFNP